MLQPDITWLGGLTEARRIVAMAAAYDLPVVPHGSSVYSYHLQYAFANCPVAELINLSPASDALERFRLETLGGAGLCGVEEIGVEEIEVPLPARLLGPRLRPFTRACR